MPVKDIHNISIEKSSAAERVSRTAFFLYVISMLIGGVLFQDKDLNDNGTSNPINQVIESLIPFVSLLCLWPRRKTLLLLLKQEKYLALILIWCFLSILWSDFFLDSLKGWVRLFGSTTVGLAFLLNLRSPDEALRYLKVLFAFYIPISFLAIEFVPYGIQEYEYSAWRGLAGDKNILGQISFISTLVWSFAIRGPSAKKRIGSWIFLFASLILLLGTGSTTALVVTFCLLFLATCLFFDRHLGRLVSSTMVGCWLILLLLGHAFDLTQITGAFGKDTSFTGRDEIWAAVFEEVKTHPFIGCGFGGFWTRENPAVLTISDRLGFRPAHAHQGYLDLLNESGIVGLFLLTLMVISYFNNLSKLTEPHLWKWFFIGILIMNLTESTLFRSTFSGWFFVFSYLALHAELIKSRTPLGKDLVLAA